MRRLGIKGPGSIQMAHKLSLPHLRHCMICIKPQQPSNKRISALNCLRDDSSQDWKRVMLSGTVAMICLNLHRSVFTSVVPQVSGYYALTMSQVGLVQSCMLWGYLAGQLPAGFLSDRLGGERVMIAGLALWSLALLGSGLLTGLSALFATRVAMGLFSAAAMPAVSSMASSWVPPAVKASEVANVYLFFNMGGVVGLVLTPAVAQALGWQSSLAVAGLFGLAVAAAAWPLLPQRKLAADCSDKQAVLPATDIKAVSDNSFSSISKGDLQGSGVQNVGRNKPDQSEQQHLRASQLFVLCWSHAAIGWGFFIFQSWIPLYLKSVGVTGAASSGLLAGLPWLAAGILGSVASRLADSMISSGMSRLFVRRAMHAVSSLGCALCVLQLVIRGANVGPQEATFWLTAFNACYAFTFGGFHAYVQDVAAGVAGKVTGLTNSCSIAMGILGNLATGWLLEATGSYTSVFMVTVGIYVASFMAFFALDGTSITSQEQTAHAKA